MTVQNPAVSRAPDSPACLSLVICLDMQIELKRGSSYLDNSKGGNLSLKENSEESELSGLFVFTDQILRSMHFAEIWETIRRFELGKTFVKISASSSSSSSSFSLRFLEVHKFCFRNEANH